MLSFSRACDQALRGRPAVAEEPLEDDARIVLGRKRRRRRAPRERVHVDAAVAVLAVAREMIQVEAQLERRQRGVFAEHALPRPGRPRRRSDTSAPSVCLGCTPVSHVLVPRV